MPFLVWLYQHKQEQNNKKFNSDCFLNVVFSLVSFHRTLQFIFYMFSLGHLSPWCVYDKPLYTMAALVQRINSFSAAHFLWSGTEGTNWKAKQSKVKHPSHLNVQKSHRLMKNQMTLNTHPYCVIYWNLLWNPEKDVQWHLSGNCSTLSIFKKNLLGLFHYSYYNWGLHCSSGTIPSLEWITPDISLGIWNMELLNMNLKHETWNSGFRQLLLAGFIYWIYNI